jgi:hypothetical protein
MKYYTISHSSELKDIGYYPQTEINPGYNPTLPKSAYNFPRNTFPNYLPSVELKLNDKAISTNLIDKSTILSFGIVVDKEFKQLLETFNLPPHRFYPIQVFHKNNLLDYYWMCYIVDSFEYIDKKKSILGIYHFSSFELKKTIPFPSNKIKLIKYKESKDILMFHKIYFNENFPNYDLINFSSREGQYLPCLFSERLLRELQKRNLTGITYRQFEKIISE